MENEKLLRCARTAVWLLGALLAVICVISVILVPRALHALERVDDMLTSLDSLTQSAGAALDAANAAAESANKLVADNAGAVAEAMEKFNSVDFDSLNRAIKDLADVVAPLARVSNLFNR